MHSEFGALIREWRGLRRFSQLELSLEAELSARHLSFLESGRSAPSRAMVQRLAEALAMPRAIVNQAMRAAGFAPVYPSLAPADAALEPVRLAITSLLQSHEPFPAIAIDAGWDFAGANAAALRFFAQVGVAGSTNLIESLIALEGSSALVNWEETAVLALARLKAELQHCGPNPRAEALSRRLSALPRLAAFDRSAIDLNRAVIPTVFDIAGARLSLFSTIAAFGSVQEVAASELRVEMMFPSDDATRRFFAASAV
jgi:transcriptional regulator with XRE-family HTH domain